MSSRNKNPKQINDKTEQKPTKEMSLSKTRSNRSIKLKEKLKEKNDINKDDQSEENENNSNEGMNLNEEKIYDKFQKEEESNKKLNNFYNFIQINAESIGIKSLDNEIIDFINLEINYKIKEILNVSRKYIILSNYHKFYYTSDVH